MMEDTQVAYVCRAAGRKHGLRLGQECDRRAVHHDRWCELHFRRIRKSVLAETTTWEQQEKGLRRRRFRGLDISGMTSGTTLDVISPETKIYGQSEATFARSDNLSRSLKKRLKALKQELDPNGIPGTYSEGVLRPTVPAVLKHPEIHSCLWLHPDGNVRNFGSCVPTTPGGR